MEKIIIYGGTGLLGSAIIKQLSKKYILIFPTHRELDVTNKKLVKKHIQIHQPNYIIYAVGLTKIDEANANPEKAYLLNAAVPKYIAETAAKLKISFIYFSSDAVFDKAKTNKSFQETDKPNALSVYGKSKLAGEKNVISASDKNLIIRVVMLYSADHKKKQDFVRKIISLLKNNKSVTGIADQFVTPLYVPTAVKAIQKLIETKAYGIYHLASTDVLTNYAFVKNIAREFNFADKLIQSITLKQFLKEKNIYRAQYSSLNTTKFINKFGKKILQTSKQDLSDFHKVFVK